MDAIPAAACIRQVRRIQQSSLGGLGAAVVSPFSAKEEVGWTVQGA